MTFVENITVTPLRSCALGEEYILVLCKIWKLSILIRRQMTRCLYFVFSCRVLDMNKNHLTSFKQLATIPQIQPLSLAENYTETLTGLSSLRCTPLQSLVLKRSPCEFYQNYQKW